MKVERKEVAPVEQLKCKVSGAVIGDKVMYSRHNSSCSGLPCYLKHDTLYEVVDIDHGLAVIETGVKWAGSTTSSYELGQVDIIVKAPRVEPEQPFQPVVLTLESQKEVDVIRGLLGANSDIGGVKYEEWLALDKFSTQENRKFYEVKEL